MRTKRLVLVVAGLLALAGAVPFVTSAAAAPADKVFICHSDFNAKKPYVKIEVSVNAVDGIGGGDHFGEHKGQLVTSLAQAEQLKDAQIRWGDIIPPVPGVHDGLNWPAGQAIFQSNCTFPTVVSTTQPPPTTQPGGKVTICHRDNNPKKPYGPKAITVSVNGALNGHAGHTGPLATSVAVAEALKAQGTMWGDIIPPILPDLPLGLNWSSAGQAILAANCQFAPPPPSTTRPPTPTTKAPTTTTKAPAPTTKPAPPTTKPAPPTSTTRPPVVPIKVIPKPGTPLAFTGSDTGRIAGMAFLMIVVGLVLVSRNRRSAQLLTVGASTQTNAFRSTRESDTATLAPVKETVQEGGVEPGEESLRSLWVQAHEAIALLNEWIASTRRSDEE